MTQCAQRLLQHPYQLLVVGPVFAEIPGRAQHKDMVKGSLTVVQLLRLAQNRIPQLLGNIGFAVQRLGNRGFGDPQFPGDGFHRHLSFHGPLLPAQRTRAGFPHPAHLHRLQSPGSGGCAEGSGLRAGPAGPGKPRAEEYNIKIAIENHCDLKTEELLDLVQRANSPYVGVCVDLGNFMIHLENPTESVKLLAPYIYSTHFKDYASEMMNWGFKTFGVPLGKGSIDPKAIVDILINESKLDRIMLELPVEKEATEAATLKKEDDCVAERVAYARNILLKDYN
ncbi:hypothetical protein B5G03_15700 [Gemmiger sp. An50]|nr:hypothetical protein B5G03_15700 [Gemmiger sp. An50]